MYADQYKAITKDIKNLKIVYFGELLEASGIPKNLDYHLREGKKTLTYYQIKAFKRNLILIYNTLIDALESTNLTEDALITPSDRKLLRTGAILDAIHNNPKALETHLAILNKIDITLEGIITKMEQEQKEIPDKNTKEHESDPGTKNLQKKETIQTEIKLKTENTLSEKHEQKSKISNEKLAKFLAPDSKQK